jgi:hypothetical protein
VRQPNGDPGLGVDEHTRIVGAPVPELVAHMDQPLAGDHRLISDVADDSAHTVINPDRDR